MKTSPEIRDAKLAIVGAPGSGCSDWLRAVAMRRGSGAPTEVDAGRWRTLRASFPADGLRFDLFCMLDDCRYRGVEELLVGAADAVILLFDVTPAWIGSSRRFFDRLRPQLAELGRPFAVQYHRIEREPRFDAGRLDAWLGLVGSDIPRAATVSSAPADAFDLLLPGLLGTVPANDE